MQRYMTRFTIYTYLFKPINESQEPDMFSPEVKVEESLARKQELLGELFLRKANCVLPRAAIIATASISSLST